MAISRWLPRGIFVGLIVIAVTLPAIGGERQTAAEFQQSIDTVLKNAGYAVEHRKKSWKGGQITGATLTLARHPACARPITVTPHSIEGAPPVAADQSLRYVMNDVVRAKPFPVRVLWEAAWLELRAAASMGQIPRPRRYLLVINDPAACLLLTDPQWEDIWNGSAV